jgi:glucokinase
MPTVRWTRAIERSDRHSLLNPPADADSMRERCSIGVDIGHTNMRVARVEDGAPVEVRKERTDVPGGVEGVLEQARMMIEELDEGRRSPVGVGIAGQCDNARGVLRYGPNFFWPDTPFQGMLSSAVGAPVVLRNDVVMATMGEWKYGAGRGAKDLACLFVGTGIGGGAVVGGRLIDGATGCGGHFGHISVQMDGPLCTCGRRGCVEAYAGGGNVEGRVRRALAEDAGASAMLMEMSGGDLGMLSSRMVAEAAGKGDDYSLSVRDEMAAALSSAAASVINSLNPERVVLGGTVLFGFPRLFDMVVEGATAQCLGPATIGLAIERSALGDLAGVVGAATMALEIYG